MAVTVSQFLLICDGEQLSFTPHFTQQGLIKYIIVILTKIYEFCPDLYHYVLKMLQVYGSPMRLWLFHIPAIFVSDPDDVQVSLAKYKARTVCTN